MSACGPSSGRAVWVPLWVPNWLGRGRYGTQEPDQIWLTGAKLWFPDGAVTPEVAGSSPVAPVAPVLGRCVPSRVGRPRRLGAIRHLLSAAGSPSPSAAVPPGLGCDASRLRFNGGACLR